MKRRLFALLAVPVLALGFAFASPSTDQAQADMFPSIYDLCIYTDWKMGDAEYYGDWTSYDYWADQSEALACG